MDVLVVDDDEDLRRLIQLIITRKQPDWVTAEAPDGRQAIIAAEQGKPDLILLDLSMPVMGGLEALPHLRRVVPPAVITVLTAFPGDAARDAALDAGASAFLEKDNLVATLIPRLREIMCQPEASPMR